MDVIGYLASALAGLPAILGIARGYGAALVVLAQALTHWPGAIVMAVAAFAFVSSEAHGQIEAAPIVSAVQTEPQAREEEPKQPGQAIYSPFFSGAIAQEQCSNASGAPEPDLAMTLAASTAGVVALVWLLQRI